MIVSAQTPTSNIHKKIQFRREVKESLIQNENPTTNSKEKKTVKSNNKTNKINQPLKQKPTTVKPNTESKN
jgi:hypothetical protein